MEPSAPPPKPTPERRSVLQWLAARSRWEKVTLMVAATAAVGGGVLSLFTGEDPTASTSAGGGPSAMGAQLVADAPAKDAEALEQQGGEPASRGVFRVSCPFASKE